MVKYPNPIGRKLTNSEAWRGCSRCKKRIKVGEEYFSVTISYISRDYHLECFEKHPLRPSISIVSPEDYWKLATELWHTQKELEGMKEKLKRRENEFKRTIKT